MNTEIVFRNALARLLTEIVDGPPGNEAYVLNRSDPGLLNQLDEVSAEAASARPMPGKTTIAAGIDHVHYGLSLLNRWIDGEANPWAKAYWEASCKRVQVDDDQWTLLHGRLRDAIKHWRRAVNERTQWDDISASGTLASAAHAAYHLGAIRQIMAAMNANKAPGA